MPSTDRPQLPPATATSGGGVDVPAVRAAIQRALCHPEPPARDELATLEDTLRAHLETLLPAAEAAVAELWRGSLTWHNRRTRLRVIREHLYDDLGSSHMAAHLQVRHLARDCDTLLDYLKAET